MVLEYGPSATVDRLRRASAGRDIGMPCRVPLGLVRKSAVPTTASSCRTWLVKMAFRMPGW
jgi:hypothetical protein